MLRNYEDYTFYIQPIGSFTLLAVSITLPERNFNRRRNLWKCTFEQAKTFVNTRENGLTFWLFYQQGKGPIHLFEE